MTGKYSKSKGIGDMINDKNEKITNTKEKCNHIANSYEEVSSDKGYSTEFLIYKRQLEKNHGKNLKQKEKNTKEKYNNPITIKEIRIALRKKKDTAEGKDNIRYSIYKLLPNEGLKLICKLFNIYWETGDIPQELKHAVTIPILKPEKDPKMAKSYRPISLTSHLGKLMETIINSRLVHHLEENNIIASNQSGFRKNRQTLDHIIRLTDTVEKCKQNDKLNIAVALDLEKAFDTVHRDGILIELKEKKIGGNMYNYIQSFLDNRTLQVRIGNEYSETKHIKNGVPQGAVISPTLFNMMINSIENNEELHKNTELGSFADDQAIWLKPNICIKRGGKLVSKVGQQSKTKQAIESAATTLVKNLNKKGFKVNVEKTQVIVFNSKREVTLNINGTNVTSKNEMKYLGVTFDKELNFSRHIDLVRNKATKSLNLLRYLAGRGHWGSTSKTLKVIYLNLIKSRLSYGEEVYNRAPKSKLDTLENIQRQALKCISGIHDRNASKHGLNILTGIPPLSIDRKIRINNLATRITANQNNPAKSIFQEETQLNAKKNIYTLRKEYEKIITQADIDNTEIVHATTDTPSWEHTQINIDSNLAKITQTNKDEHTQTRKKDIAEYMESNYKHHIKIITKGQRQQNKRGGGHTHINNTKMTIANRYTDNVDTTTTELQAILDAIRYANKKHKDEQLLICTNQLTVLREIELEGTNSRPDIIKNIYKEHQKAATIKNNNITIAWTPEELFQDQTDELNNQITKTLELTKEYNISEIGMTYKEIKKVHKTKIIETIWQKEYTNSTINHELKLLIPSVTTKIKISKQDRLINKLRINLFSSHYNTKICTTCQQNLSINHVLTTCQLFQETRRKLTTQLGKFKRTLNRQNILDPNLDPTTSHTVRQLVTEINNVYPI